MNSFGKKNAQARTGVQPYRGSRDLEGGLEHEARLMPAQGLNVQPYIDVTSMEATLQKVNTHTEIRKHLLARTDRQLMAT